MKYYGVTLSSEEKQKIDTRVQKNCIELRAGAIFGAHYSILLLPFIFFVESARAEDFDIYSDERYCSPDYIDLDKTELERIEATERCLKIRSDRLVAIAATSNKKKHILKRVGTFVYNNPNFVIGAITTSVIVGTAAINFPKFSKMASHFAVKEIPNEKLFERSMNGISDAF